MKPTKSRVLCPDCGRMKVVFESEKAALKFIEYNTEEILEHGGYAPKRVYYCDLCCGWHITGHKQHKYKTRNRQALDRCIEMEREKGQRAELNRLEVGKRKIAPSKSPAAPFLTLSMALAMDAINNAEANRWTNAMQCLERATALLEKMKIVIGPKDLIHAKRPLSYYLDKLANLLECESEPIISDLEEIRSQIISVKEMNESLFSYDPNASGATQFEITPKNVDEYIRAIEDEKNAAQERKRQKELLKREEVKQKKPYRNQAEDLIDLAYDEAVLGDFEDARKHLLEAISYIERVKDSYGREKLTAELRKVMAIMPDKE